MAEKSKLNMNRYFTKKEKVLPIEYTKSDTQITDESGALLFIQKDIEFPNYFSQLAKQIVSSRYFYGEHGTNEREGSLKELVGRVTETYRKWGLKQEYFDEKNAKVFKEELANLNLTQRMAFNSPVWFNVGTDKFDSRKTDGRKKIYFVNDKKREISVYEDEKIVGKRIAKKGEIIEVPTGDYHLYPQTSACFIQYVPDTMEGIMKLATNEAMLFKEGSGTGTDLSTLRSSKEKLSGGGNPSGPFAYWTFYDKVAGIVKSGGKTRRAAKMHSLRVDHPDIKEFIEAKQKEEKKIEILMNGGIESQEAVSSVHFQNTNVSVRVTDEFMKAVEDDEGWRTFAVNNPELNEVKDSKEDWIIPRYNAKDLLHKVAEGTYICGDPGLQYHTTINKWHTCPNSAPINASNPCSEYMFVDDSSCNLASLNLRSFLDSNGKFNINDFKKTIRTTAIAMDLNYDNSSFPTREIAQNSHNFRPLGMGYANLGGLIMSLGLPYDSDEARNIAGAITSLMTATVYKTSIEMAKKLGPFNEYKKNKEPINKVIEMHRSASEELGEKIKSSKKIKGFNLEEIADKGFENWNYDVKEGRTYGFRNAQATVLAPTGTIGFMMDCDTKGVEPEIGLVQTKLLAEGGTLRMVNGTVPIALEKLGYKEEEIDKIKKYIAGHGLTEEIPYLKKEHYAKFEESKNKAEDLEKKLGYSKEQIHDIMTYVKGYETVEGCEVLKVEHSPIFDCSNKPEWAKRTIDYMGHVKMMAAVQPFLSGAISKTVNMSKEATIEEIENVYKEAHKLGLKSIAIYRDGSKKRQPLSFSQQRLEGKLGEPVRRKLPGTANSIRHKFSVAGHEGYLHVGLFEDKTPGEVFMVMSKGGSTMRGLMDCFATSISMNLQYGVPLEVLVNKFKGQRFEPHGYVSEGHEDLVERDSKSIIDYIFNFMGKTFLDQGNEEDEKVEKPLNNNLGIEVKKIKASSKTGEEYTGLCPCGARLILKGHCQEVCEDNCGFVNYTGCAG